MRLRMSSLRSFGLGTCLWCLTVIAPSLISGQTLDPRIGTWHLNMAKSESNVEPGFTAITLSVEAAGDGEKAVMKFGDAKGIFMVTQYTADFDGRDYYYTGHPLVDTVSLKRIDARTIEQVFKKRGEVIQIITRTVSEDGRTMTFKVRGKDFIDRDVRRTLLFEKQ